MEDDDLELVADLELDDVEVVDLENVDDDVVVFEDVEVLELMEVEVELFVEVPVLLEELDAVPVLLDVLLLVEEELAVDVLDGKLDRLGRADGRDVIVDNPLIVPVRVVVELAVGKRLLFIPDVCVDNRDNAKIHNRISICL